ncbi:SDR family NAD(P)-dependent oxidoreductase [Nocardioides sp. HDW12B]|uniref:SDR family NAD(P)-dependent oxidoreductase n=1 Tax=Nocardioides sp. HDW12B TaxID=2714939 RepID=UPI00197D018E|nr:SDR family NAD(P)-dependent oxidoreductase [Nocardioides sp. HDW12B]
MNLLDTVLDRSVVLGYSKIGYALRRRTSSWPQDPAPGALAGKDVVVTGASSGLGIATADGLARLGARVHLVVRNLEKGEKARGELRRAVPSATFELWQCDVSDLDDVRRFAAEIGAAVPAISAIVHNAGAMPPERTESRQGHEMTMAIHVLGPLLMTELLLDQLSAGDGRVVMVTSGGMYTQSLPVSDPEYTQSSYKPATAYARSKRTQVSLLPVLADRWRSRGVSVYATHPGWADTPGVVDSLPGFHKVTGPILRDVAQGADTTVWLAAVDPHPPGGGLWHDRRVRPDHYLPTTRESDDERQSIWSWARQAAQLPR